MGPPILVSMICSAKAWFNYYPKGANSALDGFASLYIGRDKDSIINCEAAMHQHRAHYKAVVLGIYEGYIWIMVKKMETIIVWVRVQGFRFRVLAAHMRV